MTSKSKHGADRAATFIYSFSNEAREKQTQHGLHALLQQTDGVRCHQKTSPRNAAAGAFVQRRSQKFVIMSAQRKAPTGPTPSPAAVSVFLTHFLHSGWHPFAETSLHRHFGGNILLQIPQSSQHGHAPGVPTHMHV
jgi:hypothetical protein